MRRWNTEMKARHIKRIFRHFQDNDDLCVLWFERETVEDYTGHRLTDDEWTTLCDSFDEADGDGVFSDVIVTWSQLITDTMIENRKDKSND